MKNLNFKNLRKYENNPFQSIFKDLKSGKPFRFTAYYHGMTVGEVVKIFHSEKYRLWRENN